MDILTRVATIRHFLADMDFCSFVVFFRSDSLVLALNKSIKKPVLYVAQQKSIKVQIPR